MRFTPPYLNFRFFLRVGALISIEGSAESTAQDEYQTGESNLENRTVTQRAKQNKNAYKLIHF